MNKDIILLLNEIIKLDCDSDWKYLRISRKGFNLLVQYLEYLQTKIFDEIILKESE